MTIMVGFVLHRITQMAPMPIFVLLMKTGILLIRTLLDQHFMVFIPTPLLIAFLNPLLCTTTRLL